MGNTEKTLTVLGLISSGVGFVLLGTSRLFSAKTTHSLTGGAFSARRVVAPVSKASRGNRLVVHGEASMRQIVEQMQYLVPSSQVAFERKTGETLANKPEQAIRGYSGKLFDFMVEHLPVTFVKADLKRPAKLLFQTSVQGYLFKSQLYEKRLWRNPK